jgi:hypothetical protein
MPKTTKPGVPATRPSAKVPISQSAVSRIQRAVATKRADGAPKDKYVGRMQKALAKTSAN